MVRTGDRDKTMLSAVLFATAAVLSGCAGGDNAEQSGGELSDVTDGVTVEQSLWASLDVAGYDARLPEATAIAIIDDDEAQRTSAARECFAEHGFDDAHVRGSTGAELVTDLRFRPTSEAEAHDRGLRRAEMLRPGLESSSEMEAMVQSGVSTPSGGGAPPPEAAAYMEVQQRCMNADSGGYESVRDLAGTYVEEVLGDRDIAQARQSWSSCIEQAGFGVASSGRDVVITVVGELSVISLLAMTGGERTTVLDDLEQRERAAAVAMYRCDVEAYRPVLQRWNDLEQRWLSEHADTWNSLSERDRLQFSAKLMI